MSKLRDLLKSKSTQKQKFEKQTMLFFFLLHIVFFLSIADELFKTGTLSWEADGNLNILNENEKINGNPFSQFL